MREKGEWEPPPRQPVREVSHICIVAAQCLGCMRKIDIDRRHIERLPPLLSFEQLQLKLRCNHCDARGRVRLYIRKRPRN